ncbi:multidrug transporter EmrE-like cation transporter [Orbus hercynius]|uniref:Multidrug transporter EmrE-like cation transporter n=1 Tax=Orbus hercynius TaxID=593135 RepID=A0A495RBD9_9GAMM|nr:EamA family transporter [Orbus hercynius]RKS84797.1 multidrug transporter EmrE-like cation transporter [Orbus hercynius]
MRKFYLIGFALLLLFDTVAQTSFKLTANYAEPLQANIAWLGRVFNSPWIYIAILGYIGSFFTWMSLLKKAPVGPAFAASHLEVVTVMLVSIWIFNEPITLFRLIGAGLIIIGIIFLALAEKNVQQ